MKIFFLLVVMTFVFGCNKEPKIIELPCGQKLVGVSFYGYNLNYLTRPMRDFEQAEEYKHGANDNYIFSSGPTVIKECERFNVRLDPKLLPQKKEDYMSDYDDLVLDNTVVVKETVLAILVRIPDVEGDEWIPKSVIHDDSEVWKAGDEGTLIVQGWWAEQNGLI